MEQKVTIETPWIRGDVRGSGEITEVRVNGVKFVPEKPDVSVWRDEGGDYVLEASRGKYVGMGMARMIGGRIDRAELNKVAADALYEYMRREHGD